MIGYLQEGIIVQNVMENVINEIDDILKSKDMLWLSDNYPKAGWNK